jgi:hypothetical protein
MVAGSAQPSRRQTLDQRHLGEQWYAGSCMPPLLRGMTTVPVLPRCTWLVAVISPPEPARLGHTPWPRPSPRHVGHIPLRATISCSLRRAIPLWSQAKHPELHRHCDNQCRGPPLLPGADRESSTEDVRAQNRIIAQMFGWAAERAFAQPLLTLPSVMAIQPPALPYTSSQHSDRSDG